MSAEARRNFDRGVRWAIKWLHEEAREMNDPHAKSVLNSAGFHLGTALAATAYVPGFLERTTPTQEEPS